MESWNLKAVALEPHSPRILASGDDARTILLSLPAGGKMQEHEVHERARVVVVEGEVDITAGGDEVTAAGPGHLFEFAPQERHSVVARTEARLLLVLSPWPGEGHPGAMTLEQKAEVREAAARHADDSSEGAAAGGRASD